MTTFNQKQKEALIPYIKQKYANLVPLDVRFTYDGLITFRSEHGLRPGGITFVDPDDYPDIKAFIKTIK